MTDERDAAHADRDSWREMYYLLLAANYSRRHILGPFDPGCDGDGLNG
jgi:hypothetical protein